MQVTKGDPMGQARWEAYTLLIAMKTWESVLRETQGQLAIRGDALGVLQDVLRMRARDKILNDVTGELALIVAPFGGDVRAAHLWSEQNTACDQLSRLKPEEKVRLSALVGATFLSGTLLGTE